MIKIDSLSVGKYENIVNDDCPSSSGIIAGECKGHLWVDNIENPKIAIANSYAVGSFTFLGRINNEDENMKLRNHINSDIFNFLNQKEKEYSFRITKRINKNYSLPSSLKMQN